MAVPPGDLVARGDERGRFFLCIQISLGVDAKHGGLENTDGTSGFQPGSSFKAFVLAEWYQENHSPYTSFNTSPTVFPASA